MAAADTMMVLMVGGVLILGVVYFMNNPEAFGQLGGGGVGVTQLQLSQNSRDFGTIPLNERPIGYTSPKLDKIRTSSQLDRSQIGDFIEGIRDEIGANYAYAYPGKKLGQQPNFVPKGKAWGHYKDSPLFPATVNANRPFPFPGANYGYAYPGKKLGQMPGFMPPGQLKQLGLVPKKGKAWGHHKDSPLFPGRRGKRRRGFRSHMAIHYE